jgi:uncharacterized protein (TIGR03000 family)
MKMLLQPVAISTAVISLTLAISGTSRAGHAAPSNTATIEVSVPPDAKIWFDDSPTAQTGSERYFESPPLTPGKTYSYAMTAQWRGPDGKDIVRKQQVSVRANATSSVEFAPRVRYYSGYYTTEPACGSGYYGPGCCSGYYEPGWCSGYYGGGRRSGYYRVGNVIINGRRWGDIGYRYSHADLIRW